MFRLHAALAELKKDLNDLGVSWALIGGLAVSARAEPRTTRDIDVSVAVESDLEAERLVRDLLSRGYEILDPGLIEQEALDRIATVRLDSPNDGSAAGVVVDLMFASSGIEPEIVAEAEEVEFLPGLEVPIAKLGHLITLKVLAARPQDLADLDRLLSFSNSGDLALARRSVRLIMERGTNRRKDLAADLAAAVRERTLR